MPETGAAAGGSGGDRNFRRCFDGGGGDRIFRRPGFDVDEEGEVIAMAIAAAPDLASLPWDVFANILSLLPVPCLARLRALCRSWRALLSSAAVLRSIQLRRSAEWWFVMADFRRSSTSSSSAAAVRQPRPMLAFAAGDSAAAPFPIPSAAQSLLRSAALSQSAVPGVARALVASAAGLIAAVVPTPPAAAPGARGSHDVFLCNPLAAASKRLPRPRRLSEGLVSSSAIAISAVSGGGGGYRVLLSDAKLRHLEFYDSAAQAWLDGADIGSRAAFRAATYDHLLAADLLCYRKDAELVAFDGGSNVWRAAAVPFPAPGKASALVKAGGGIVLVAGSAAPTGRFWVYELRKRAAGLRWEEVAVSPPAEVGGGGGGGEAPPCLFDCRVASAAGCAFLCLTGAHFALRTGEKATEFWPPLLYDVSRRRWYGGKLAAPPGLLCLFPFTPRFDSLP